MKNEMCKEKAVKKFFDDTAKERSGFYDDPGGLAEKFQKMVLRIVINELRFDGRLLDVGCGRGRYLTRLSEAGVTCIGVDISKGMLKIAKTHLDDRRELDFSLVQSSASRLPFADASFGFVICIDLLHNFANRASREQVVRELARVIKPDGRLVIEIKNKMNIIYWMLSKVNPSPVAETVTLSEPISILKLLGFNVIETKGVAFPISILSPIVLIIASRKKSPLVGENVGTVAY